jgi:hypothetical protein
MRASQTPGADHDREASHDCRAEGWSAPSKWLAHRCLARSSSVARSIRLVRSNSMARSRLMVPLVSPGSLGASGPRFNDGSLHVNGPRCRFGSLRLHDPIRRPGSLITSGPLTRGGSLASNDPILHAGSLGMSWSAHRFWLAQMLVVRSDPLARSLDMVRSVQTGSCRLSTLPPLLEQKCAALRARCFTAIAFWR